MQTHDDPRPPREVIADMLRGAWICQSLSTLTRLNVPDILAAHGPLTAAQLAAQPGVAARPDLLERVLRACASVGVFGEDAQGRFSATPLSDVLTTGADSSMKRFAELFGGPWWQPWGDLEDVLESGQPAQAPSTADPDRIRQFAGAMRGNVSLIPALLDACDLSRVGTLVDVGGGFGHMSAAILERHRQMHAVVLDLPEVVHVAQQDHITPGSAPHGRLAFVGGDMFSDVPEGDAYLISRVLHDWDDEQGVRILQNCRRRMKGGSRIICLDAVIPMPGDTGATSAKFLDLLMMVLLPGKERTEREWHSLLARADLVLRSIILLDPNTRVSVIEATAR
jgi:SAM-dependent methyltransferase